MRKRRHYFPDEHALLINDPEHSNEEERFILLGLSATLRTLVVCHCYREKDEVIRIISARKADRSVRNHSIGRGKQIKTVKTAELRKQLGLD